MAKKKKEELQLQPEVTVVQRGRNITLTSLLLDAPRTLSIQTKEERDALKLEAQKLAESYSNSKTALGKKRIHNKLAKLFELEEKVSQKAQRKTKLKDEIEKTEAVKKSRESISKKKTKSVKEAVEVQKKAPKVAATVSQNTRRGEPHRKIYGI